MCVCVCLCVCECVPTHVLCVIRQGERDSDPGALQFLAGTFKRVRDTKRGEETEANGCLVLVVADSQ